MLRITLFVAFAWLWTFRTASCIDEGGGIPADCIAFSPSLPYCQLSCKGVK